MGQARVKQYSRQQLLKANPWCIYCGKAADTTDHCPPRAFFSRRIWPETFEFPSCSSCNAATRWDEQIAAVLVRSRLQETSVVDQREWEKLCDGVKNNHPEVVAEWTTGGEARRKRFFREAFGEVGDAFRRLGYGTIHIGPRTKAVLTRVAVKIGRALFYRHIGRIFSGDIYVHQVNAFSKEIQDGAFERIVRHAPYLEMPARAGTRLDDQFQYRFNASSEEGALNLVVRFSEQMVFQIIALQEPMAERLQNWISQQSFPDNGVQRVTIFPPTIAG